MTLTFGLLRQVTLQREAEYDPDDKCDLSFLGNELGGESGEAQNVIKKLERERLGLRGKRSTIEKLAEELADVIIVCAIIAAKRNIDLERSVTDKFNSSSEELGLETRIKR